MNRHMIASSLLVLSGCMTGPLNGDTSNNRHKTFFFQGYFDQPATPVDIQYLVNADSDPTIDASWRTYASTTTGTQPISWHDPTPLYAWSLSAAPGQRLPEASWPVGGLLRLRAWAVDRVLTTFDQDFNDCFNANINQSWQVIGNTCKSAYGSLVAIGDSQFIPANTDPNISYLDRRGVGDSNAYYDRVYPLSVDEYGNLDNYYRDYDILSPSAKGNPNVVYVASTASASFYDDGDLGMIRTVSCTETTDHDIYCMADNFGVFEGGANQVQPAWTSADSIVALNGKGPTDPDAMLFTAFEKGWVLTGSPKFFDQGAGTTSMPNTCLVCHGGRLDGQGRVVAARFLPLDPAVIRPLPGADPLAWQESVRQVNRMILKRPPTAATADVLGGEYANAVGIKGATADPSYVPAGWGDTDGHRKLYEAVVKPYCRTCHNALSAPGNPNAPTPLNFATFGDFYSFRSVIADDVCKNHEMPNSQHSQTGLWSSPGRAYLVGALGLNTGCGAKAPPAMGMMGQ